MYFLFRAIPRFCDLSANLVIARGKLVLQSSWRIVLPLIWHDVRFSTGLDVKAKSVTQGFGNAKNSVTRNSVTKK